MAKKQPADLPPRTLPLIVSTKQACVMLSVGPTQLFRMMKAGDLISIKVGGRRKITVQSIYDYINRLLAEQDPDTRPEYSIRMISQPDL